MKFHIMMPVQLKGGGISGVICDTADAIPKYGVQSAYEVQWIDGTVSVHLECELQPRRAANDETYA